MQRHPAFRAAPSKVNPADARSRGEPPGLVAQVYPPPSLVRVARRVLALFCGRCGGMKPLKRPPRKAAPRILNMGDSSLDKRAAVAGSPRSDTAGHAQLRRTAPPQEDLGHPDSPKNDENGQGNFRAAR